MALQQRPPSRDEGWSEYKNRYREYDYQPRVAPFKPDHGPVAVEAHMETSTTSKRDFVEHPVQKLQPLKPSDNNLGPQGKQDFTSSYSDTFLGRTGERTRPIRQDKEREELGRFEGEPTYKAEFREWSLPPRAHREADKWQPPKSKLDTITTSHTDFPEHMLTPRQTIKPREEWSAPDGPFETSTGYRDTFKEHEVARRRPREREPYTQPMVKFDYKTTKQSDYKGAYQPMRESCRPDRSAFTSDAPFDGSTTTHADFQEKPIGEKYVHGSHAYVRPEGKMNFSTTNQEQFREFPISRNTVEKPRSSHILYGKGPMAGESGYTADFADRPSPRREIMKPKAAYQPPTSKFGGLSTSKEDFVELKIVPRKSYRPDWQPVRSNAEFPSSTENRSSFVEKPLPPKFRREHEMYSGPSVPFNASTTTKDSFLGEFVPKRASFKPDNTMVGSDAKFEGKTTSRNDFKEYQVTRPQRHQYEAYTKPQGDMELITSNRENFQDRGLAERHGIIKPGSSHILRGEGKFGGSSSYKGDFAEPPPHSRQLVRAKNEYHPSADRFDATTTHKTSFQGAFAPKQGNFKPPNRPLQNLNGFEDNTGYRTEYQHWRDVNPQVPPVSV